MYSDQGRYDNFLDSYSFFSNCIEFRIKSSKALEKWKNVQAFQLNQLTNGKFYFSADRREVILLNYDIWTRWLCEIENLCLELSGGKDLWAKSEHINYIIGLAAKSTDKYKEIMREQTPKHFNEEFVSCWVEQHENVFNYMITVFKTFKGMKFVDVFVNIATFLTEVMRYMLLEIHELNSLFCIYRPENNEINSNECLKDVLEHNTKIAKTDISARLVEIPFISVCNLTNDSFDKTGFCLVTSRVSHYINKFGVTEVYIKNYTDEPLCCELISRIRHTGVIINFEKSLIA